MVNIPLKPIPCELIKGDEGDEYVEGVTDLLYPPSAASKAEAEDCPEQEDGEVTIGQISNMIAEVAGII